MILGLEPGTRLKTRLANKLHFGQVEPPVQAQTSSSKVNLRGGSHETGQREEKRTREAGTQNARFDMVMYPLGGDLS